MSEEETSDAPDGSAEQPAYDLIVVNGYEHFDRFSVLEAAWPELASSLPAFRAGPNQPLQTICAALAAFLEFSGRWEEWLSLALQAEARAVAAEDWVQAGWRAYDAGWVHNLRENGVRVVEFAQRAEAHFTKVPDAVGELASAIRLRGIGHRLNGIDAAALRAFREALKLRRSAGTADVDLALGLNDAADAARRMGEYESAERDYLEALRIATAGRDDEDMAVYTGNLAMLALEQEDWPRAESRAREALPLAEKVGRKELIARNHYRIAKALVMQGKREQGLPHAQTAVALFSQLGTSELAAAKSILWLAMRILGFAAAIPRSRHPIHHCWVVV